MPPAEHDFRAIPSVDRLSMVAALADYPEPVRRLAAREAASRARSLVVAGETVSQERIIKLATLAAHELTATTVRQAINMSGVVLHTGLGRARLAESAQRAVNTVAGWHSSVEFDLESGKRGDRQSHLRGLLCDLTGAEDALVVNNNAAALFLALHALCEGQDVLLSRGQMVEIGGSFRMPDIVAQSGCNLVEVGCTNKTHIADYEKACSGSCKAVLLCHPSNFKIVGFHEEPTAQELISLCKSKGLLLIDDVGSGCLVETERFGLPHERTLREALQDGADIVTASGDKLLGGPQAGIVLGRKEFVSKIAKHPLARALRIDKFTLAALEATLRLYREGREGEIPVWRYLAKPNEDVRRDAQSIAEAYGEGAVVQECLAEIGGGSLPGTTVPSVRVGFPNVSADKAAKNFRTLVVPVIGYIEDGVFWLDPRTADPEEVATVCELLTAGEVRNG